MTNICVLDLLEQPPIELLLKHMKDVQDCVKQLRPFVQAIGKDDWAKAEQIFQNVVESEHQADTKKAGFRKLLRKDLILQISKSELLKVVIEQDKIANLTRDVCGLLLWRKQAFPENVRSDLELYVDAIIDTCNYAMASLEIMAATVDAVFSKDSRQLLDEQLGLLEQAESVTDDLQCKIRSSLLECEKQFTAVQMICYYDIINQMGTIADQAESYGHLLFVCVSD